MPNHVQSGHRAFCASRSVVSMEQLDGRVFLSGTTTHAATPADAILSAKVARLLGKAITTTGSLSAPDSVAAADFNGDHKMDAVIVDGNGVKLLLGNGDGTFKAPTIIGKGTQLSSIKTGDFNGDGKPDIVFVGTDVQVLINNGKTFTRTTRITTGTIPQSVLVGDFNKDKKLDLAVVNIGSDNVRILMGDGTGTFSAGTNFAAGNGPTYIAAGDFNGDHRIDLAIADTGTVTVDTFGVTFGAGAGVSILTGNGHGSFHAPKHLDVSGRATGIAAADFDHNGKLDVALALGGLNAPDGANDVGVLLGNGDGTLKAPAFYKVGADPEAVYLNDFNRDGLPDLVSANFSGNNVSVLLSNGNGTFQKAQNFVTGSGPGQLVVADFNKDKINDLLVADFGTDSLSTLLGA